MIACIGCISWLCVDVFHDCAYGLTIVMLINYNYFFSRRPVFSSARWPMKILECIHFCRLGKPMKLTTLFSSVSTTDENTCLFRRLLTKMCSFSSILFHCPIFIDRPTKIYIFDGFLAIFDGFWPTKLSYFLVVVGPFSQASLDFQWSLSARRNQSHTTLFSSSRRKQKQH
jgi:hypothetical protein